MGKKKKLGLSSPRWKHHMVFIDLWLTKDGSIQVFHWLFSLKGVWSQIFASLSHFKPVSVADPETIRCSLCAAWSTATPMTWRATLSPSTSSPTPACLCQPSAFSLSQRVRKVHSRKVCSSFHSVKTKAKASSLRYSLPADKRSVQGLSSSPCHRHLLPDPLRWCPVLFWGSKASLPGDDHR